MSKSNLYRFFAVRARATVVTIGVNDCALFQADCHMALTGVDLAAPWRGSYTTYREGLALMRAAGYADPRDMVRSIADRVTHAEARLGDLCFLRRAGGIVVGAAAYVLGHRGGLVSVPVDEKLEIYRVR